MKEGKADRSILKKLFEDMAIQGVTMKNGMFETNSTPGEGDEVFIQGFNHLSDISRFQNEDGMLYVFRYGCGVRMVSGEDAHEEDPEPFFEVVGEFEAAYSAQGEYEEDVLTAFGNTQVGMAVWPYWREFAQSTTNRMDIHELRIGGFPQPDGVAG